MDPSCTSFLSEAALRAIPSAGSLTMDGGQCIPLQSTATRTTTTMRQVRVKGQAYNVGRADSFQVGMDINLIIKELHQNTLRHVCVEDIDRSRLFADPEVRILAAALEGNTSIITLRIPGCHATDVSLIPLYKSLRAHPTIRSLDVSDTKGSESAGRALVDLVCKNTQIVHVERSNIRISQKDSALLDEALMYNCFNCQDPGINPYDASLIRYIDRAGKIEREVSEQVTLQNPWMVDEETGEVSLHVLENIARLYAPSATQDSVDVPDDTAELGSKPPKRRKKRKGVSFGDDAELEVHRQVCDDYMNGRCRYGSRCKFLHPERTSASMNRILAVRAQEEEEDRAELEQDDGRTTVVSRASTRRLRGRTHSTFKFDPRKVAHRPDESNAVTRKVPSEGTRERNNLYLQLGSLALVGGAFLAYLRFLK